MMKAIAGSMVGGLVAGTIALVASGVSQPDADSSRSTDPAAVQRVDDRAASSEPFDSTIVQCEPNQQATMRRAMVDGREVSTISCISTLTPASSVASAAAASLVSPVGYTPAAMAPAATVQPAVIRERVVERQAPRQAKRSWKKSALVIGGTSGAGAGIGALIGGKKGALIGAAIGGGSGAIYEVTKR